MKILPINILPYEKLELYGEESLSLQELLAIILRTGTKNKNAMQIAKEIMELGNNGNSLRFLQDITINDLIKIEGIGKSKAIQIKAACEIAKRCVDSDYNFDFKEYFKEQIKRRLWGVPIVLFISNLPLVVNYIMVEMAEGFTIYTSPISVYKFSMTSMFFWELLGEVWFFAPILFPLFFFVAFSIILYFYEKTFIPAKPSWKE